MFSLAQICFLLAIVNRATVFAQQCYYAPGETHRGPTDLVPCGQSGNSACCLLGDVCLSGSACYDLTYGTVYQYGCTDQNYEDPSCPQKCNYTESPWVAMEYCSDIPSVDNTWVCHAPESCGCQWTPTWDLLSLEIRGCREMGSEARVALYAPSALEPYASLPTSAGGSTGYYTTTMVSGTSTWVSTPINGYTPSSIGPLTTYSPEAGPTSVVQVDAAQKPDGSTYLPATAINSTATPLPNSLLVTSTSSTSSTSSMMTTTTSAAATSTAPVSSGLSTGAKAGIGVGVSLGVLFILAVIGAIWLLFRRTKKNNANQAAQQQQQQQTPQMQQDQYQQGPPQYGQDAYAQQPQHGQGSPYFAQDQHDKTAAWQGSPYGSQGQQMPGWAGHPNSPPMGYQDSMNQFKPAAPHSPPMELPAEHQVAEMDSRGPMESPKP